MQVSLSCSTWPSNKRIQQNAHGRIVRRRSASADAQHVRHTGGAMIVHEDRYTDFIEGRGVGSNDAVASSPKSYVSYLNSVSALIGQDMSPANLRSESDVLEILSQIDGMRAANTLRNYRSAMRQYVAMVEAEGL